VTPHKALKISALIFAAFIAAVSLAGAGQLKPQKIGPKDKCPVCGMFVAKYPDFAAQIQFRDGTTLHFDGAKDMFKCYLNLPRYAPGKKPADILALLVTDYYELSMVDGLRAFYVVGSDVYGPMGRELVPFATESKARDFLKDHRGKSLVRFREVTVDILRKLD
jgi:copper chaperone NosL